MLTSLKDFTKKIIFRFINPPWNISYSQAGEDAVIDFLFSELGIKTPTYLELGVQYPDIGNNTYRFYLRRSRGVLVEADKTLIPSIKAKRPEDIVINVGVGVSDMDEMDFFIFDVQGLNTFSKEEAYKRNEGRYKIKEIVKVRMVSINRIIEENFKVVPDFLSIDIEGLDLSVLKTLDFERFPIPVICAETCLFSENHIRPRDNSIAKFMLSKGYFIYADTYINTFFVNEKWFFSQGKK
jgi:FkbM family methyltransferase